MPIAAEKLPLPHRDVRKKKLTRRCQDATAYKKILLRRCRDSFQKMFQISLPRLYWAGNIGTRPSDSFSLRLFHL
jgi:hypothetical protein